jgi:hypothetical protein
MVLNTVFPLSGQPRDQQLVGRASKTLPGPSEEETNEGSREWGGAKIRVEGVADAKIERLVEGQTISLQVDVPRGKAAGRAVFFVNDVEFATDERPPFTFTFTTPHRISQLKFSAQLHAGAVTHQIEPVTFDVVPQTLATVSGRAVDDVGMPMEGATVQILAEGLYAEYFDSTGLTSLTDLDGRTPDVTGSVTAINHRNPEGIFGDLFGVNLPPEYAARFTAWLKVSTSGSHTFVLGADGGARLKIADVTAIDIPKSNGEYVESLNTIDVSVGWVPIEITHYGSIGNKGLQLSYASPGGERQVIAPEFFLSDSLDLHTVTDELGIFSISNVSNAFSGVRVLAVGNKDEVTRLGSSGRLVPKAESPVNAGDVVLRIPR